jgi:hypothetical protein
MATVAPAPPRQPEARELEAPDSEPEQELRGWLVPNDPHGRCHALVRRTLEGFSYTLCGMDVNPPVMDTHRWTGSCPYGAPSCADCVRLASG